MTEPTRYNFHESEAKWQKHWQDNNSFAASSDSKKPKYYVLEMFPYPSGNIHMGHVRNYTLGDVVARVKRAQGFNVLHPMGWDAFGLPAENAAIQNKSHPADWTLANIATMREQLKKCGLSYDWSRELATCLPEYYKHEQAFFLKFLEAGLAYRKEAEVNWDPVDNTVLANEQVVDGRGWRSGALVERRKLSQWFLRISDFSDDLLAGLEGLKDWPEKVRIMQEKWIGKSQGATLQLAVGGSQLADIPAELEIYTTRPDTIFGMSFCAISPGHPLALKLQTANRQLQIFIEECGRIGTSEEAIEKAEKKGFDTGLKIIHPFDGREVPLYVANFVLMDYGTGAIFGCPAHDQRDFEFATKYKLPILPVVSGGIEPLKEAYTGDGVLINSDFLNGLSVEDAKKRAIEALEKVGCGTAKINYRLRDWGISRQRYWGCPIPIIHCEVCGVVPVPEKNLPVELPRDVTFDKPGNPLDHHPTWKHVDCPKCGKAARRETDTFDTFFESSWYFARYATLPSQDPLEKNAVNTWLPVDCYIGGIEHAVLHLLYSRFFCRALTQCGLMDIKEPFKRLETQGMICHETYKSTDGKWLSPEEIWKLDDGTIVQSAAMRGKNAEDLRKIENLDAFYKQEPVTVGRIEKMSKSKKNTVDPRHIMDSYGTDAARLFMLSDSPPDRDLEWTDAGIEGAWRYINRVWKLAMTNATTFGRKYDNAAVERSIMENEAKDYLPKQVLRVTHKTIKAVGEDVERFHFNKAIARIRELTNLLETMEAKDDASSFAMCDALTAAIHLIQPFMPHLAEETWQALGHKDTLSERAWPTFNPAFVADDEVTIAIQINGKTRTTIQLPKDMDKTAAEEKVLQLDAVRALLQDKKINKVIVVPNRIVNVVAS
ncbi:MAG: leucine--tRNA ligase [Alphaproteobacteria bacterium]